MKIQSETSVTEVMVHEYRDRGFSVYASGTTILQKNDLFIVEKSAKTFLPIIIKKVKIKTTIHSDKWKAYLNFNQHESINHNKYFTDLRAGINIQNIEFLWHITKIKLFYMSQWSFPFV